MACEYEYLAVSRLGGSAGVILFRRLRASDGRPEHEPAAAHQSIQRRLPARDYQEFHYGSVLCGQPRRLGAGWAFGLPEPNFRGTIREVWLVPLSWDRSGGVQLFGAGP